MAIATAPPDLHSFKLAHPIMRTTSRVDLTALSVLSIVAITIWLLVLPVEFMVRLTV